jgi:hypothetical protein
MPFHFALSAGFLLVFTASAAEFVSHEIATGLKGGYQVIAADLNHDGKPDLIALAPGTNELVWFENPSWQRHVIVSNVPHMINCAAWDIDGDGIPEIALSYEFSNDAQKSLGIVTILRHDGDPTQPWTATEIDRLPTSHRLRWADIHGNGKKVLINAPLTNGAALKPEDRLRVPLVYYDPADWKRRIIPSNNQGVQHGIFIVDWEGKGREAILTASFSGLDVFQLSVQQAWRSTHISPGATEMWPHGGSSDVAVGQIGRNRFLAAIEPWHGNRVAVYRQHAGKWLREQIDDSLTDGHTIITADFDNNGKYAIIAGERSGAKSLHLYTWHHNSWVAQTVDPGVMAAASCIAADLNSDGRTDFACISPVTQNLKWYENRLERKKN